jgi:multidrug efflux pump subunit AcrA (membrane-fusion protein)
MSFSINNNIKSAPLIITLAVSAGLLSCNRNQQEIPPPSGGTPVRITNPALSDLSESIDLNANTVFLKKETVRATFQGFIDKINKNIGDKVKTGDLLLQIKTKELAADDSLKFSIGTQMFGGSVQIYARSDGILTALQYNSGDFVSEGEEIAIISNPSSLRITLNIPYQYNTRMNHHSRCEIFLPDGRTEMATIDKVIPSVDPISQTQTFLLQLDYYVNLPENLNVIARLPLQTIKNALVLPRRSILSNETQDEFWVMKLINDTTAIRVNIIIGIENDSMVQIIRPAFSLSDSIILEGAYGLADTARISIAK